MRRTFGAARGWALHGGHFGLSGLPIATLETPELSQKGLGNSGTTPSSFPRPLRGIFG